MFLGQLVKRVRGPLAPQVHLGKIPTNHVDEMLTNLCPKLRQKIHAFDLVL